VPGQSPPGILAIGQLGRVYRCLIIPGEPLLGILKQLRRVFLKSRQVMEWVDVVESASVNKTHEQIPDVSAMFGLEEQGVLPMKDDPLEDLFAKGMPTA